MRYQQIKPQNNILDEVRMGQSDLDQFLNSPEAQGVVAGFEAELCFVAKGGAGEEEEDYDQDERARSIDDIARFFRDGDYNARLQTSGSLRERMENSYYGWRAEQMSNDWHGIARDEVRKYIENNIQQIDIEIEDYLEGHDGYTPEQIKEILKSVRSAPQRGAARREYAAANPLFATYLEAREAVQELLDEKVEEAMDDQNKNYKRAREYWEDYHSDDNEYDDDRWLQSEGIRQMSDVINSGEYNVSWPYYTSKGGFNSDNAQQLADGLEQALGVNVVASDGYHSTTRKPGLWIIEPDSSLQADDDEDLPAEIVSPPMPLGECIDTMGKFFEWAKSEGAYSNSSTGLHVGVSLPDVGGNVDYVKLALFLGDQYVLEQFGRQLNYYAESALKKIKAAFDDRGTPDKIVKVLDTMKKGLIQDASLMVRTGGHSKYTSINLKGNYIEFRSMGNDYMDKVDVAINMVKRYAYAMTIAANPDLYRQEYAKKLYKLLDKTPATAAAMQEFANYVTAVGGADAETVKAFIRDIKSSNYPAMLPGSKAEQQKKMADTARAVHDATPKKQWLVKLGGTHVWTLSAATEGEANEMTRQWLTQRSAEFTQEYGGKDVELVPVTYWINTV